MKTAEIKEYLGMVVDLEKQIYMQNRMITTMQNSINKLGKRKSFEKPQKPELDTAGSKGAYVLAGIVLVIYLATHRMLLIRGIAPVFILVSIGLAIWGNVAARDEKEEFKQRQREYQEDLQKYQRCVQADKQRVEKEKAGRTLLQAELESLQAKNMETKQTLEKLYSYDIIHKNYRGLITVCSLYGYFDTGVCTQLEGHEGAYNKYDTESRLDYIVRQLNEVLRNLEQIKQNQRVLYDVLQTSNQKLNQLISNTDQMMGQLNNIEIQGAELSAQVMNLQATSELALYETACNRQETAYLRRMAEWGY